MDTCKDCLENGYDECLCQFCRKCGHTGHMKTNCKTKQCCQCKGWHLDGKCPLGRDQEFYEQRSRSPSPWSSSENETSPFRPTLPGLLAMKHTERPSPFNFQGCSPALVRGIPIYLQSLGPINRTLILKNLISKVRLKYEERYASVLESESVEKILEENLNPAVREICDEGRFTLHK